MHGQVTILQIIECAPHEARALVSQYSLLKVPFELIETVQRLKWIKDLVCVEAKK